MVTILNPKVCPSGEGGFRLARRPVDLNERTIGFLDNGKRNFSAFVERAEELLHEKFKFTAVHRRKPHALKRIPAELLEELIESCDVIVTGSGD